VKNPFRSEGDAFRFVWLVIGYGALIVIGSLINTWVGLAVFVVLTALAVWWGVLRGRGEPPIAHAPAPSPPDEHRILVVANETVGGHELLNAIMQRAEGRRTLIYVVAPALNTPLKTWTSDEDGARATAQQRLEASLSSMRSVGLEASGEIGDGDPVQAIEDAMRTFRPDEVIVSTHPPGKSNWLERGVIERVRERIALPLTHVVVDLDADRH
jgi:GABA permease